MTKWIRADHAQAEKEAAVASAYEDAAELLEDSGGDGWAEKVMAEYGSVMAETFRDRSNTDALAARDAQVRAEALRELLQVNRVHRDKNWYPSLEQSILALIPSSNPTNKKHDE